jgi:hypothetical protein
MDMLHLCYCPSYLKTPQRSFVKSELSSPINACDVLRYCNQKPLRIFTGNLLTKVIMGNSFSRGKGAASSGRLDVLRGRVAARPKAT